MIWGYYYSLVWLPQDLLIYKEKFNASDENPVILYLKKHLPPYFLMCISVYESFIYLMDREVHQDMGIPVHMTRLTKNAGRYSIQARKLKMNLF